jgi:type II secretory pathway pseudopilin PulG
MIGNPFHSGRDFVGSVALKRLGRLLSRGSAAPDRGDTLVEILVTIVIISLAVVALLGGVLASTTASATGRNVTTVDNVLKSFAETARYNIQTQSPDGSSGPQYLPCALPSQYKVISAPYPSTGPTGSVLTVFATGFDPTVGTPVTFTSTTDQSVTGSSTITAVSPSPSGPAFGAMVMFSVPSLQPGSYTIAPFGNQYLAAANFTVTSSGTPSNAVAFDGYQLNSSIQYWTGSSWSSTCSAGLNSNLQQLSYQLIDTQTGNGASDSASFVVADFAPLPVPTLAISCSVGLQAGGPACDASAYALGTAFTFSATLSPFTDLTGNITWTLPAGESCDTPQPEAVPPLTVTCTVTAALAGTLNPVAIYSGDATHSGVAASLGTAITVNQGSLSLTVTGPGKLVEQSPSDLQFTVNVGGIVPAIPPTGQVQLTLTAHGQYSNTNCFQTVTLTGNSPPPVANCVVYGATSGSYTVTATYPGDANYAASSASHTIYVENILTLTVSPSTPTVGQPITVKATVNQPAGAPAPAGGTITWSGVGVPASCTPAQVPPSSVTCTLPNTTPTPYSVTATYSGDANYAGGSASIYVAAPVLRCNGCRHRNSGGSITVTATITPPSGAPAAPTGTVTWNVSGDATSCTGGSTTNLPAAPGPYSVTCTIANDVPGTYNFTVTYNGDSTYLPETSAVLTETVG